MSDRPPSIFENYDDELVDLITAAQLLGLPTGVLHDLVADQRIMHYLIHDMPCFAVSELINWQHRHPITAANQSRPPSVFTQTLDQPTRPDHGRDDHDGYRVIDLPPPRTLPAAMPGPLSAAS